MEPQQHLHTFLTTHLPDLGTEETQQLVEMLEAEDDETSQVGLVSPPVKSTSPPPTPNPPHRIITTINYLTEFTSKLLNQYINHQKQTGTCGVHNISPSKRRIRHHVRQHFCLSFCCCKHQTLSRDRLYSHLAQHMKQGESLDTALHMIDKEGTARSLSWWNGQTLHH